MNKEMQPDNHLVVFNDQKIRRVLHVDMWWFVITDIITALTDTTDASQYIKRMKSRDKDLLEWWKDHVTALSIETAGGIQKLNCANTEGVFRIIQSIPSTKAEPFKRWLAKVGYERVQEIEDPELSTKRTRELYKAKGYPDSWIEKRMRGIAIHEELTDEWSKRGIKESTEYAILTAEISKATFGMTPTEYKQYKKLKRENLRDHMTDLELIFNMLGEASTTAIAKERDPQGFKANQQVAKAGGKIAGDAREKLEKETGKNLSTRENYLLLKQKKNNILKSKE